MAAIYDDDTLSQSERNQLSTPSTPVLSCRDIRNIPKRNALDNLERQKSIEVFRLPEELLNKRQWPNKRFHHVRWIVMMLAASGLGLTFIIRLSITVAIVKMVNQTALYIDEHPNATADDIDTESMGEAGEFQWNNFIQSLVINSYYVGYALPQIYLSHLADKYGVNKPIIISQVISILATALIPSVVYFGWEWAVLLRFVIGLAGAATYPISVGMIDLWIPSYENTRALTLLQFVSITGIVFNPLFTSYFCTFHWSMVFYVTCIGGVAWLLLWLIVVRNSPEECWLVSQQELKIILSERKYRPDTKRASPPWRILLVSRNFYLFLTCWVVFDGTAISLMNILPTYMRTILKMNIQTIGTKTSIIQSASLFSIVWSGELVRFVTLKLKWKASNARIMTYGIAATGALITGLLPCIIGTGTFSIFLVNKALHPATEFVLIGTIIDEWASVGLSGTMFSVYNTFGCGLASLFSWSAGYILDLTGGTPDAWNWLFVWFGCANFSGFILFLLMKPNNPVIDSNSPQKL